MAIFKTRLGYKHAKLTKTTIEDIEWCWSIDEKPNNVQWQLNRLAKTRGTEPQTVHPQTVHALYEFIDLEWHRAESAGADLADYS